MSNYLAIIAILAAILFPVFARARENARRSSCQSNLKQIALGVAQYTQDYDERMIALVNYKTSSNSELWPVTIQPYVKSTQIFDCPSFSHTNNISGSLYPGGRVAYGMNIATGAPGLNGYVGISLAALNYPSELIMLGGQQSGGDYESLSRLWWWLHR